MSNVFTRFNSLEDTKIGHTSGRCRVLTHHLVSRRHQRRGDLNALSVSTDSLRMVQKSAKKIVNASQPTNAKERETVKLTKNRIALQRRSSVSVSPAL